MTLRQHHLLFVTATLALAFAAPPSARAESDPASIVKPLVVFLLDTSGSMEYESGTATNAASEFTVPLCEEPNVNSPTLFDVGNFPSSRLIVAKEVLTGSYRDYWCRYDYRDSNPDAVDFEYPVPHVKACSGSGTTACNAPAQEFDGLLDVYRDFIQFGFMTFDSREDGGVGEEGMWSYGPAAGADSTLNLGVKNTTWGEPNVANEWDAETYSWTMSDDNREINNRGQLMAPPAAGQDDFSTLREMNRMLQYEVNSTIGYWGTPLAPMLEDAEWFLREHPNVRPWNAVNQTGDPYSNCRERIVVLITDGRASMGEAVGGYPTTIEAIESLKATPPSTQHPKVYVVGFNLENEDASLLDEVADHADGTFMADTATGLRTALAEIFSLAQADVQSRTEVVYTNATHSSTDLQYQFNAAFQADPDNPTNLKGFLNQTIYRCSAECVGIAASGASCAMDLVSIHDKLNTRDNLDRDMYVAVKGELHALRTELVALASDGDEMADLFGVKQSGNLDNVRPIGFDGPRPIFSQEPKGPASDLAVQKSYMRELIELLRADDGSARQGEHMGGVVHANPITQEAVTAGSYPLRSWSIYTETPLNGSHQFPPKCRPTVLYTGTHDGMIHAFRVDHFNGEGACEGLLPAQSDDEVGEELWSIMPQHLLKASHGLVGAYRFLMDGQMRLADVLLVRANPTEADAHAEALDWRSVLTAGYGDGGRGYIALDVTNALDGPNVMWEIDNKQRCKNGTCYPADGGVFSDDFSKLGLTKGRPAYGTAFLDNREVAIAVLPGGDDPQDGEAVQAGRVVYIVRLDTGEKVAEFSNDTSNVKYMSGGEAALDFHFTGSPAIYSNVPGVVSTRAFVGDAGGRLWRIDMRPNDPDDWKMELFFDTYEDGPLHAQEDSDRQPLLGAPTLALNASDGHLAVVFGNGGIDHIRTASTSDVGVFSVSETLGGGLDDVSATMNWAHVLEPNERLTGGALIFNKSAYFTTYLADPLDACAAGSGRIYGLHFTSSSGNDPQGTMDADDDPTTLATVSYVGTGEAVPFGVQIIERPSCQPQSGSSGLGNVANSANGVARGELQLVVNVAKGDGFDANSVPAGVAGGDMATKNLTRTLHDSGEMVQGGTWGYVLF
jgi:hypothetical protein